MDALLHRGDAAEDSPAVATRTPDGWEELTYAALARRSGQVAARLAEGGAQPGSRVVLKAEPGASWLAALLGILRCGAVAVPVDPGLTPTELAPVLERSDPVAVLAQPELEEMDAAPEEDAGAVDAARPVGDPAMIVWTSGTTGAPKGVTLSYANLSYSVEQAVAGHRPAPGDRWLSVLPPHHLLELCCGVLPALASGGMVWFARSLMPHELSGIIGEHGLKRMVAVPLLLRLLEREVAGTGLEVAYCGGAPLDPAVVDRYASKGIAVYQGYGLTEAAPTVSMNTPDDHRAGSVGRPLPGTEVRTGDAEGQSEILVRSPAVMLGYWQDQALTAEVVDDQGWLHTGDLGFVDGDGFLFVTGRAKRLVVLESGKNVQPEEVELAIAASDLFDEVCVVGVSGAGAGGGGPAAERVCAVVVPGPVLVEAHGDAHELQEAAAAEVARCTATLSGYKRPTLVRVHQAPLPRTLKGSPRHAEVAEMVRQGAI